jgi:hypothetical protein
MNNAAFHIAKPKHTHSIPDDGSTAMFIGITVLALWLVLLVKGLFTR